MSNKKKNKNVTKQLKKAVQDAKKAGVKLVKVEIR
ncbi:putative peroxiredoxin [Neobacillus niacini]|nr:putative peroxiredoxin [Neobacillus niacini]